MTYICLHTRGCISTEMIGSPYRFGLMDVGPVSLFLPGEAKIRNNTLYFPTTSLGVSVSTGKVCSEP